LIVFIKTKSGRFWKKRNAKGIIRQIREKNGKEWTIVEGCLKNALRRMYFCNEFELKGLTENQEPVTDNCKA
jgi:hypothetical protein